MALWHDSRFTAARTFQSLCFDSDISSNTNNISVRLQEVFEKSHPHTVWIELISVFSDISMKHWTHLIMQRRHSLLLSCDWVRSGDVWWSTRRPERVREMPTHHRATCVSPNISCPRNACSAKTKTNRSSSSWHKTPKYTVTSRRIKLKTSIRSVSIIKRFAQFQD